MGWNANGIFNVTFNPDKMNKDSFEQYVVTTYPAGAHPLFAMSGMFPRERAVSAEHGYFTKAFMFPSLVVDDANDLINTDTTLVVDATAGVVAGMTFQVPATREIIRIVSVDSATSLTISRAYGRVAAGAILNNAILFCTGNSHSESSNRPTARNVASTYVPNYTTIFRNAWAVSETARASQRALNYMSNVAETKEDCVMFHTHDFEAITLWSQPKAPAADGSGNLVHATQGIIDAIYQYAAANVTNAGSTTTYAQLETAMALAFASTNSLSATDERVCLCDRTAMKVIVNIGRLFANLSVSDIKTTTFGMVFTEMNFYAGRVRFVEDKALNGSAKPSGLAVVLDPNVIKWNFMEGRDHVPEEFTGSRDSISSGVDATMGGLLTEMAVSTVNPASCAVINGLTAAAAS